MDETNGYLRYLNSLNEKSLEKFDEEQDLSSMVEFFKYEMEKTWEVTLDNYHHVKKVTSKLENHLNNYILYLLNQQS